MKRDHVPAHDPLKPNPPRPKVRAAGQSTLAATTLTLILRAAGVDVDEIDPAALVLAGGALATTAAFLKRDGLAGAWQAVWHGEHLQVVHPDTD